MTLDKLRENFERAYYNLMQQGYKLHEIDNMDIFYYLYILEQFVTENKDDEVVYIDQIIW